MFKNKHTFKKNTYYKIWFNVGKKHFAKQNCSGQVDFNFIDRLN